MHAPDHNGSGTGRQATTPSGPGPAESGCKPRGARWKKLGAALGVAGAVALALTLTSSDPSFGPFSVRVVPSSGAASANDVFVLRNQGGTPGVLTYVNYETRAAGSGGGWRQTAPPELSDSMRNAGFWAIPGQDGLILNKDLSPGAEVPLECPRPSLPRGSSWRLRLRIFREVHGFSRLKMMVDSARLRAMTGYTNLPWVNFGVRYLDDPKEVYSPEVTAP